MKLKCITNQIDIERVIKVHLVPKLLKSELDIDNKALSPADIVRSKQHSKFLANDFLLSILTTAGTTCLLSRHVAFQ